MFWTNRTYKEEDKDEVWLPSIKREFKSSKFILKKKNKTRINSGTIQSKIGTIDLRKTRQFNTDSLKFEVNSKDRYEITIFYCEV